MDLSVIVVSHGHEAMLPDCLASLPPALEGLRHEVIVLDNLPDGTAQATLAERFPDVIHLRNAVPAGFSANLNRAAAVARGRHMLFLNPDTVHESGRIADAIAWLGAHPDFGLLGCRLLNVDGTVQQNYRRFPTLPVIACRALGVDRWAWQPHFYRNRMMQGIEIETPTQVDWVFGAFMLVRKTDYISVNGMDEVFRLYYEDVDLCYRLRKRGLKTVLFSDLRFTHRHMRSSAQHPFGQAWRWHLASALRILRKHGVLPRPDLNWRSS